MNKNVLYRSIPKVDILLADEGIKVLIEAYSRESVMEAIHSEMEKLRAYIGTCDDEEKAKHQIALLNENIAKAVAAMHTPNMKKVINGTGTILHTNLGRAPISYEHMMKAAEIVSGYSNLEYNLEAGRRGERYSHFEKLLCKLTGADFLALLPDDAFLDGLALGQQIFQFFGADVLTVVEDDDILLASGDVIEAVLVHTGQVAGVEPAVGVEDFCGGLGVLVIAQHDAAAADADFARLVQLVLGVVVGLAHGADVLFVLLVVDDAVAAGLGHAVHLSDHHALLCQLGQHGAVKHGRGAAGVPDAVQADAAAPLDVFVDGLHQHGSHSDGIAVHQAEVAIKVADVGGEVQRPALAGPKRRGR